MLHTMVMPKLGLTMEEGLIARWLRSEGDAVKKGEALLVIETEKITYDIEAPTEGILHIVRQAGETVAVASPVAVVAATQEAYSQAVSSAAAVPAPAAGEDARPAGDASAASGAAAGAAGERGGVRASPLARRLAAEAGLALAAVKGTGPGGRITREDVEAAVAARGAVPTRAEAPAPAPALPKVLEVRRLSPMRRTIAARLAGSLREMAQLTVMADVDMSAARALREELNRDVAADGARITYTDLVVKLAALALKAHPVLNATLRGEELHLLGEYHIGVAVEIEDGLIVPVIRDADRKSLRAISRELAELSERARARRLGPEDLQGGTFTVSNAGMLGVDAVTPIINPPEVAILGVGRIADRALAVGGRVEARPAATLCLTFDHRVVDGAPASRFLADMRRLLEEPRAALAGHIG
ncbi:MAG: hypothetical protein A2X52_17270 [Candidatus Rokubacteria bacterium GWC2_70_16]|nr:MAG: hypothetical protein A2X52_17270 [Candidatus Rokubacteria bacterium GWC2_70_16]